MPFLSSFYCCLFRSNCFSGAGSDDTGSNTEPATAAEAGETHVEQAIGRVLRVASKTTFSMAPVDPVHLDLDISTPSVFVVEAIAALICCVEGAIRVQILLCVSFVASFVGRC